MLYAIFLLSRVQKRMILRRKHTFQGSGQLVNFKGKCITIWVTKTASGGVWSWCHGQCKCMDDTLNGVIQFQLALPQHSLPSFPESRSLGCYTHSLALLGSGQWCIQWQARPQPYYSHHQWNVIPVPQTPDDFVNLELSQQCMCREEYIINNTEYKIVT